jgi:hypothetical protein
MKCLFEKEEKKKIKRQLQARIDDCLLCDFNDVKLIVFFPSGSNIENEKILILL